MDPRKTGQAHANRKHLLGKVEECIRAANQAVSDSTYVIQTHDAFVKAVGEEFENRDTRLQTQGEWIQQVEGTALTAEKSANLAHGRIDVMHADVAVFFYRLTIWQRLRWVLFGVLPAFRQIREDAQASAIVAEVQA